MSHSEQVETLIDKHMEQYQPMPGATPISSLYILGRNTDDIDAIKQGTQPWQRFHIAALLNAEVEHLLVAGRLPEMKNDA